MNKIVEAIEKEYMKQEVPQFEVGDTVKVYVKVVEGTRERLQAFEGIVIAKKNGVSEARVYRVINTFARKRTGPSWTKHDITVLLKLRHAGMSIKSISAKLHRKQPSVYAKLTKIQKYLEHVMEEESNAG